MGEVEGDTSAEGCEMTLNYPHKRTLTAILASVSFILSLPAFGLAGQFKVTGVTDGDTIVARGHDIEIRLRLVGIDAPEISHRKREPSQPYGGRAKKYLAGLILNKTLDIEGYGLGPYNRVLGVIHLNGKTMNLEMIKVGLAEVYRGRPRPIAGNREAHHG